MQVRECIRDPDQARACTGQWCTEKQATGPELPGPCSKTHCVNDVFLPRLAASPAGAGFAGAAEGPLASLAKDP